MTLSMTELHWRERLADPNLSPEERDKFAAKIERSKKKRLKRKYTKKGDVCPDHAEDCDGLSCGIPSVNSNCPVRAWVKAHSVAGTAPKPMAKPVAAPAPAPKITKPAPVVEPALVEDAFDRLMCSEEAKIHALAERPRPVDTPVPQVQNIPMLPGATFEESKSCWLLEGWGTRMKPDEYEHHTSIRDAYDKRITAERAAAKTAQAALAASLPKITLRAEEIRRADEQAAISAVRPPEFREPRRGPEMNMIQLAEVTKPTIANAKDGGVSVERHVDNYVPEVLIPSPPPEHRN